MTTNTLPATRPAETARLPLGALLVLSAAVFITVTAESLPAGLLPEMAAGLHTDPLGVGLLISVWALTVIVSSVPLARLTRRVDRRLVAGVALAVFGLANAATALAPTYGFALATRIGAALAHGLFWAIVIVYATSLLRATHLGRGLAIVAAGGTMAALAGIPAGTLVAQLIGWRWAFGVLALAALALSLVILRHLPARRPVIAATTARAGLDCSVGPLLLLGAASLVVALGQFATFTYVRPLLEGPGGVDAGLVPLLLLGYGAAGLVGVVVAGPLADRWPRAGLLVVLVLDAAALAALAALPGTPLMVVAVLVWGAAMGAYFPLQQSQLMRTSTERTRSLAGAGIVVAFNVGIAVGPWLGDLAGGADSPTGAAAVSAAALAVGVVLAGVSALAARRSRTA